MKSSAPRPPQDRRRAMLAKIHLAKKDLGLDEDTYRLMLREIGAVDSAADLDMVGLARVLDHMHRPGLQSPGSPSRKTPSRYPGRPNPPADRVAMIGKIEALLADAKQPWAYADAIAKRMCAVDKVAWATPEQLRKVISALVYNARRHGRRG